METKNQGNEMIKVNVSDNFSQATNSTSREYVFAPVSYPVKLTIFTVMLSCGVYGMIANSLILYYKYKQHRRKRHEMKRAFRRTLTEYFINSLALSDLFSSLISLPLFSAEMFIDLTKSDSICRFTRVFTLFFSCVTMLNLLVIGVERYLTIFHPFFTLNRKKVKRMVIGTWVLGFLLTLVGFPTFRLVRYENIGGNFYTLVCKYDSSVPLYRAIFIFTSSITYFIPSFILTFINLRILKRQRTSQRVSASETTQRALSRLRVTRMFVSLIFAFILPYLFLFMYLMLMRALKINVSFTVDYIVRHISVFLLCGNGSVSATILIYYEKLYLEFLTCCQSRSTRNVAPTAAVQRKAYPVSGENKRKTKTSAV